MGFYYGVLQAIKSYLYAYKGIEIVLVEVPEWGYYFEAEILANENSIENANQKLMALSQELGVKVLNEKDFYRLLEDLSNRPGFRFDFKKQKFSDIKKRFINYF